MEGLLEFGVEKESILDAEKLERVILKAKLIGYIVRELKTDDNNRCCLVSKGDNHTLYILDNIEKVCNGIPLTNICKEIKYLTGNLRVVGGKNLVSTSRLFEGCQFEEYDFSGFKAENILEMKNMFAFTHANRINLYDLKTYKVEDMDGMFYMSNIYKLCIGGANTNKVNNFDKFFAYCTIYNIDLENLKTINATSMRRMFMMSNIGDIDLRHLSINKLEYMDSMFEGCRARKINLSGLDFSRVKSMNGIIHQYSGKLITTDKKLLEIYKIRLKTDN